MAKAWVLSLLLLFFALPIGSLAERQRYQRQRSEQCCTQVQALEPTRHLESEGGRSEFWDHTNEQLQCAGVSAARHTIQPRGLLLPSSSNSPRLVYVLEGQGIGGMVIPGCSESYSSSSEESSRQQIQGRRFGRYGEERSHVEDQHQKIHHLRKGDIIAVPAGVTIWSYNNGDRPLTVVSIVDTGNYINQLDSTPRRFFLGGRFSQQRDSRRRGSESRRRGEQEEESFGNIFDGFDTELLAEALGISRDTASKLQSREERRGEQKGMIIRVEQGLQTIKPLEYEEEEYEEERRGGRRGSRASEEERRRGRRGSRESREEEEERRRERRGSSESEEEEEERERRGGKRDSEEERRRERRGSSESEEEEEWERRRGRRDSEEERRRRRRGSRESHEEEEMRSNERGRRGERERREEERKSERRGSQGREEEEERRQQRRRRGFLNGIGEETVCSLKFKLNVGNPRHSDVYSTEAGRLTTLNSFKLPLLEYMQLGADVGLLRRNAIMGPKWNANAHSIKYVIRGSARVQIVDSNGNSVMDERVTEGQLYVVPQNFVEVTRAEDQEYEWVSFHTTDYSISNHLAGKGSTLRGIPVDVLANSFDISREEARNLKEGRSQELAIFVPRSHQLSSRERRAIA